VLTILLLLTQGPAAAGPVTADDKESLRGLGGFYLIGQFTGVQLEGLTTNNILKLARTALQKAHISIDDEPQTSHGEANLSLNVNTIKDDQLGLYLFSVQVAVFQDAQLVRPGYKIPVAAQTWTRNIEGLTTPNRTDAIELALKRCIDDFIAEYVVVNPASAR